MLSKQKETFLKEQPYGAVFLCIGIPEHQGLCAQGYQESIKGGKNDKKL